MTARLPRLLIGSSVEGLPYAEALARLLSPGVDVTLWNQEFFVGGEFTLESLETRSRSFDGALVVATADDQVLSRGSAYETIRDNLIFEFGLFVATFGRRRALLLVEDIRGTHLPSDLLGLTCIGFDRTTPPEDGLEAAANAVLVQAESFAADVVERVVADRLDALMRTFLGELQIAMSLTAELGLHTWVVDERSDPPELIRVARARNSPKGAVKRAFLRGVGVVGYCWDTGSTVFVDLEQEPFRSADRDSWGTFGPEVSKGMNYELLEESRRRYRALGAVPLVSQLSSGLRFLGCISYNVGRSAAVMDTQLQSITIENTLNRTAEVARIVLESR